MAKIKPGIVGGITGKIGDYVVRRMNGKYFVSLRPDKYKISQSGKAKKSRSGFGLCVMFAKNINTISELSLSWKLSKVSGTSSYHKIIKHNIPLMKNGSLSDYNIITPEGFDHPFNSVLVNNDSVILSVNSLILQKEILSGKFKIITIVLLHSPKNKTDNRIFIHPLIAELNDVNVQNVVFDIPAVLKNQFDKYLFIILYSTVIWFDAKNRIHWSSSFAREFPL